MVQHICEVCQRPVGGIPTPNKGLWASHPPLRQMNHLFPGASIHFATVPGLLTNVETDTAKVSFIRRPPLIVLIGSGQVFHTEHQLLFVQPMLEDHYGFTLHTSSAVIAGHLYECSFNKALEGHRPGLIRPRCAILTLGISQLQTSTAKELKVCLSPSGSQKFFLQPIDGIHRTARLRISNWWGANVTPFAEVAPKAATQVATRKSQRPFPSDLNPNCVTQQPCTCMPTAGHKTYIFYSTLVQYSSWLEGCKSARLYARLDGFFLLQRCLEAAALLRQARCVECLMCLGPAQHI